MPVTVEPYLKGTNNLVNITLTEGGTPIPDLQLATEIRIKFGPYAEIVRTGPPSNQNGVDWSQGNGLVVLNPAVIEAADPAVAQVPNQFVPGSVRVIDGTNTDGTYFGGADSDPRLMFSVRMPV